MSSGSPQAYLLWAILSCIFLVFLISHLWSYDRFECVKWHSGRQPGAFKRIMTYSYLGTLPLLIVFSVATTVIKFQEGYIQLPGGTILPRPYSLWGMRNKQWVLPLYFILSVAWSLELVTHLEELTFWLFLLHQGPTKRDWFHSWEFRAWYIGSTIAVIGMPITTVIARREIDSCLGWIFLVGTSAGTSTTVCFLYVLARFPSFVRHVQEEGAEPDVVVRLATFYQLNRVRIMFRFLFTLPLMIIAVDSIRGPYPIINNPFAMDFLLMIGGIGCFVSSAITLLIFFPRSIAHESGYKARQASQSSKTNAYPHSQYYYNSDYQYYMQGTSPKSVIRYPVPEVRMGVFRFPENNAESHYYDYFSSSPPQFYPLDRRSFPSHPSTRPRTTSVESDMSPGYESDAESTSGVPSPSSAPPEPPPHSTLPSAQQPLQVQQQQQQQQPRSQYLSVQASQMALHPPSISAAPSSEDTVWERDQVVPLARRRRHSDGPYIYDYHERHPVHYHHPHDKTFTTALSPVPASIQMEPERGHEEGLGHEPPQQRRSRQLHPYLINFTSSIDFLDSRNVRSSRSS